MFRLDKNTIATNTNYSWFANKLSDDFSMDIGDHSKIIFGYNGIGKSTIFKCIKEINSDSIEYLDYENKDDKRLKDNKLEISVNINQISLNNQVIEETNGEYDAAKILKNNYSLTKKAEFDAISNSLNNVKKNKVIKLRSNMNSVEKFINDHPDIKIKPLIDLWKDFQALENASEELKKAKDNKKYLAYKYAYDAFDEDNLCPICGSTIENLKQIIKNKIENLKNIKSEIVFKLKEYHEVTKELISEYYTAYNELKVDDNLLIDYLLCSGDLESYKSMKDKLDKRDLKILENQGLVSEAQDKYNSVKTQEQLLKRDLKRYFKVENENVIFDDINHKITIQFDRAIGTFSTGELNLMVFLYHVYSFLGSDKDTMILDDPASSLDLINHYKIAFEIVRTTKTKKMVVLTHSVDFVNTINSQNPGKFKFYYLEEANNQLYIQLINNNSNTDVNVISLVKLSEADEFIDLLKRRESDISNNTNSNDIEVFHYTETPRYIGGDINKLSNHQLSDMIDNFTTFTNTDFYTNSLLKIKYLCALRVWLERKLYEVIPQTSPMKNIFLEKKTINEKIDIICPNNGSNPYGVSFSREELMVKKVMLNQGVHYHSQVMPMAYAINLSLDQLEKEINEIKSLFSN